MDDCSNRYALVEPIITDSCVSKPLPMLTGKDRFNLVEPILCRHMVVDISLRMLEVEEIKLAQSFPKAYSFTGNHADQVKQIGNAVCPKMAEALVAV